MKQEKEHRSKPPLVLYDLLVYVFVSALLIVFAGDSRPVADVLLLQNLVALTLILSARLCTAVYRQIWRYGGIQCYLRFVLADALAFGIYWGLSQLLPILRMPFITLVALFSADTLLTLFMRLTYRYAYKYGGNTGSRLSKLLCWLLKVCSWGSVVTDSDPTLEKTRIAIVGAGSEGIGLAESLASSDKASYSIRCFLDDDSSRIGRDIHGIAVLREGAPSLEILKEQHVQEVVFAVPAMSRSRKMELYEFYQKAGFRIRVYDYPSLNIPGRKRQLRDFNIEDLLMREQKEIITDEVRNYYWDKVVLITGGGGSIGSELCRQLAKMTPKQLIILDIYENNAYDLRQGLTYAYKGLVDIRVEIASIRDKKALARVFQEYHPDICINAAAHKHVPLMEKNCIEAVENNVFGALNVIQCCEEFGCSRFMMVSTDKAVTPTNIMGATKRMCEMIMQAYSTRGTLRCSATRFGNVLGSAGSVIRIFKRQIQDGGPITVTDKRITRYFMTIPEASQLVLTSGTMARNGELFVLDMGKPVKIYDLARNMITISGMPDIEIVETGLRPGEKLYEELLVKTEGLEKTDHDMIFVEHEEPVSMAALEEKLSILRQACDSDNDDRVRQALHIVVPSFRTPEEVNSLHHEEE